MAPPGNGKETGRPPCGRAQGGARSACRHPPGKESGDRFPGPSGPGEVLSSSVDVFLRLRATVSVACRVRFSCISLSPKWASTAIEADFPLEGKSTFLKIIRAKHALKHFAFLQKCVYYPRRRLAGTGMAGRRAIAAADGGSGRAVSKASVRPAIAAGRRSYNGRGSRGNSGPAWRRSGRERASAV